MVQTQHKKLRWHTQESVLHWPRKGGNGRGKGKKGKSKASKTYMIAVVDSPPPASKIFTACRRHFLKLAAFY